MIEREEQKQNVNTLTEKNADNVNFYFQKDFTTILLGEIYLYLNKNI